MLVTKAQKWEECRKGEALFWQYYLLLLPSASKCCKLRQLGRWLEGVYVVEHVCRSWRVIEKAL